MEREGVANSLRARTELLQYVSDNLQGPPVPAPAIRAIFVALVRFATRAELRHVADVVIVIMSLERGVWSIGGGEELNG